MAKTDTELAKNYDRLRVLADNLCRSVEAGDDSAKAQTAAAMREFLDKTR